MTQLSMRTTTQSTLWFSACRHTACNVFLHAQRPSRGCAMRVANIVSTVFLSTPSGARWVTIGCPEEMQCVRPQSQHCVLTHTTADQSESSSVIQRMGNVSRHVVCFSARTAGNAHHDTVSTAVFCVPPHSLQCGFHPQSQRRVFEHTQWCGMGYPRSSRGGRRCNVCRHTVSTVFVRTHCGASLVISGHHHAGCVRAHVASTSSGGLVSSTHRSHDV